jgi:hypothetical protein
MAPEQARGEKNLGPAVDVYALGAILYELLAGRQPFQADTPINTIRATLEDEPSRPSLARPGVPSDLETICLKCLEKEPSRRYPSAEALANDLHRWLAGEPITARPVETLERLWKWSRRHPGLAGSLVVIGALVVSIAIGSAIVARHFERVAREKGELVTLRELERDKAEQAGDLARRQEQAERWERYRANIMTAVGALELNNTNIAQLALLDAPEEHRRWEWRHFESLLDRSSATLPGHPWRGGRFRNTPSSPDGNRLVLYDQRKSSVLAWDVSAPKSLAVLPLAATVTRPDGKQLATITFNNHLHIWDLATGKETSTIRLGNEEYWAVPHRPAYNPAGTLLAATIGVGKIGLWDPLTGHSCDTLPASVAADPAFRIRDLAFSPDGTQLAASATDAKIRIWDVARRVELATLSGHSQPVYRLAYNRDGTLWASGSLDHTIRLWDGKSFRELAVLSCDSNVYGLAFTPDGTHLAAGCADNTIRLWDVARRRQVAELRGHEAYVHALAFSPDGTQLVSASGDWTVRLWDSLRPADRARRGAPLHAGLVRNK